MNTARNGLHARKVSKWHILEVRRLTAMGLRTDAATFAATTKVRLVEWLLDSISLPKFPYDRRRTSSHVSGVRRADARFEEALCRIVAILCERPHFPVGVDATKGCLTASAKRLSRKHLFFEFASKFS
jgi:hypothetical protein